MLELLVEMPRCLWLRIFQRLEFAYVRKTHKAAGFYCSITTYHKHSGLKQHILTISLLLWVIEPGMVQPSPLHRASESCVLMWEKIHFGIGYLAQWALSLIPSTSPPQIHFQRSSSLLTECVFLRLSDLGSTLGSSRSCLWVSDATQFVFLWVLMWLFSFGGSVAGIELRALHLAGRRSTT